MSNTYQRVLLKLASPEIFDNEERGMLKQLLFAEDPSVEQEEKIASDDEPSLEIDPEIFKEAMDLAENDPETLAALIEDVAGQLPADEAEAIIEKAAADVQEYVEGQEKAAAAAFEFGYHMMDGFDARAQEKLAAAQESEVDEQVEKVAEQVVQRAPHIARALANLR